MSAATRLPGAAGLPTRVVRRMRMAACTWLLLAGAWLLLAAWPPAARAMQAVPSDLYRCQGTHGEIVFTGRPDEYAHCKPVNVTPQKHLTLYAAPQPAHGASAAASAPHGPVVLRGSVYRVVRPDGTIEYTNVRPGKQRGHKVTRLFTYIDTCFACSLDSSINWQTVPLDVTTYRKAVQAAAKANGLQPAFLRAVIHAESAFDPEALSTKGAQGLMQLMPATASSMGVADAFDATQNISGGARYLAQLLKEFHGDHQLAAAAYNAGPQAVHKYDGVPPYAQTQVYVKRVGILYKRYAKALAAPPPQARAKQ